MTAWTVIVELDIDERLLDQARNAVVNAVRFETGQTPALRTIRTDAFHAALGHPYTRLRETA